MEIKWSGEGSAVMFSITGPLTRETAEQFWAAVDSLGDMIKDLVIDCEKMTFLDREGLRRLVLAQRKMQKRGSFSLIRVQGAPKDALMRSGLFHKFEVLS